MMTTVHGISLDIACGVPCLAPELERGSPEAIGALLHLFEKAVAFGGRWLGVSQFDQPGVEAYTREMRRLLGC